MRRFLFVLGLLFLCSTFGSANSIFEFDLWTDSSGSHAGVYCAGNVNKTAPPMETFMPIFYSGTVLPGGFSSNSLGASRLDFGSNSHFLRLHHENEWFFIGGHHYAHHRHGRGRPPWGSAPPVSNPVTPVAVPDGDSWLMLSIAGVTLGIAVWRRTPKDHRQL